MDEPLHPKNKDKKNKMKRRSTRRHRVQPETAGVMNPKAVFEIRSSTKSTTVSQDSLMAEKLPHQKKNRRKTTLPHLNSAADVFTIGKKVQESAERFKMKTRKWKPVNTKNFCGNHKGFLGIERDPIPDPFKPNPQNEELISYFAQLALDTSEDTHIDLELVEVLLTGGANVNATDRHGQTILHEASRAWEQDVAQFLIEKGADVNKADLHGRTALHISAAVDYPEMISFLIEQGANIEAMTRGENQTPMHFAARNDACNALKVLHKHRADIHSRDYKGRTPLQIAGELDRSETAKLLLDLGADASDKDNSGLPVLVLMITKMPAVASEALDQLHRTDRANRKQYFYLNHLEPAKPDEEKSKSRTALQVVVQYNQLELIMHPVFQRLIDVKWEKFGKLRSGKQVVFSMAFILIWTTIALALEVPVEYDLPQDTWRIVLEVFAVALTIYQIVLELQEYFQSKRKFETWKKWRISEIKKDFLYCHPRWPQEEDYLQSEIEAIKDQSPVYFSDSWNYFDWFVYVLLMTISVMHIVDIFIRAEGLSAITKRVFAVAVIFIWLRFMKTARAFKALGPFIVMLGHIVVDMARFLFLYAEFFIPYACAFWMIFGNTAVQGMMTVDQLLFTLFRMTLVDEYDYEGMKEVDMIMAYILVISFLAISAIMCLNILIAVLSDTFQRVYDNAKSNAVMQQASIILSIEDGLGDRKIRQFRNFIHSSCAPDAQFYDDDQMSTRGEEMRKVTFQIKDTLEELGEQLSNDSSLKDAAKFTTRMQEEITRLHAKQDKNLKQMKKMNMEMKELRQLMVSLIGVHNAGAASSGTGNQGTSSRSLMGKLHDNSLSDSSDNDDPPSRPRFAHRRTPTQRIGVQSSHGSQTRSPDSQPLGLESILSQSFSLGPHKIPSVLLPNQEEVDEHQRLLELRKEKQKQHKLRREQEYLFQQRQQGGGDASDGTATSRNQGSTSSSVI